MAPRTKIQKFTQNTAWIINQNIFAMLVGIFVSALVARYFGPTRFGEFNYAASIIALFTSISTLGMETLTVKSILDKEYDEGTVLFTSFLLRVAGGIVLCVASAITVRILQPQDKLLQAMAMILSIAMIFRAAEVIDYWAQAYLNSKITSAARIISLVFTSSYKLYIVFSKGSIFQYAFATLLDAVVVCAFLFIPYVRLRTDHTKWKINLTYALDLLKKCWFLVISGLMITVYMRIDQVMLGSMLKNKTGVGLYAAAVNIAQMWYFVPTAIQVSFKSIVMEHKAKGNQEKYEYHMIGLYSVTIYLSVAFAIGISIFSPLIVHILYGKAYLPSASILIISIWGGVFAMLGTARSVWLVTENLQRYSLIYASTGCVTNVVLNLFLIPHYGAYGAAVATVITQFFNIIILLFFKDTRQSINMMLKSLSPKYIIDNAHKFLHMPK